MINTIIFDMDGVIIDSEPRNLKIIEDIYDELGIEVPREFHLKSIGVESVEWWKRIIENFGVTGTTPEDIAAHERDKIYQYTFSPNASEYIFDGVEKSIKDLKDQGLKLAVASSSPGKLIKGVLKVAGLDETFDAVISAADGDVKRGKPEPDIFLKTADELNSKPEECLVIEDSESGLEAAKKAGMKTLAFLSAPVEISLDNADYNFKNYSEFLKIVSQII